MRSIAIGAALAALLWPTADFAGPADNPLPQYSPDQFVGAILNGPAACPRAQSLATCEANPKTRRWSLIPARVAPATSSKPLSHHESHGRPNLRPPADAIDRGASERCESVTAQDICVTFAFDSDIITPQGRANLESAAAGLGQPALSSIDFEVAGYTDASGAMTHNLDLSRRRARAVTAYLLGLGVQAGRLKPVGYGPEHLADPSDPGSPGNRRVELHRLN